MSARSWGAGVARACGLPDVAELQDRVMKKLESEHRKAFARQLEGQNLEQALSRLRRLAGLLTGHENLYGLTAEDAVTLDRSVCRAIIKELDVQAADLTPVYQFAAWVARANYRTPLELFTINYALLLETALDRLRVPYFDGYRHLGGSISHGPRRSHCRHRRRIAPRVFCAPLEAPRLSPLGMG
jgi:hypothetical protein